MVISSSSPIPITVFTGFVGAGKTTTILGLLQSLPFGYRACLLKNEFGDVQVDSQLAKQSSLTAVNEILNGCMCCILVGQMKTALLEIKEKYNPDRIFIETSGSAFPATLAFQIRELERETNGMLKLDAIVTVIDAENFTGYEDTSPTARMQAEYTDVILINKWENVSERQLDVVLDHLHTLNDLTPKIRCNGKGGVDPKLIFGLDTKLFNEKEDAFSGAATENGSAHNDEVEAVTVLKTRAGGGTGQSQSGSLYHQHQHGEKCGCDKGSNESTAHLSESEAYEGPELLTEEQFIKILGVLPKESVWRVKGYVRVRHVDGIREGTTHIVNWAFGRVELTPFVQNADPSENGEKGNEEEWDVLLTVMGERGEVRRHARRLAGSLGAEVKIG